MALEGGNMNEGVVRIGDTVRRGVSPWTPTIHRLLAHVRAQGVRWVPRVHGIDDEGREVLDYIPGEVRHDMARWQRDESILADVARALRQWHDATTTFEVRPDDVWFWPGREPREVICHNDFAPYNHVFRDHRFVGAIDYDICYPAPRLWDLAYTAYRYVPLTPPRDADVADGAGADRSPFDRATMRARLAAFLHAYAGDDPALRYPQDELVAMVAPRLIAMAEWCAEQLDRPAIVQNGLMYRAHAEWLAAGGLGTDES